jgi:hypothetical protein
MRLRVSHLGVETDVELAEGTHTLGGAEEDAVRLEPLPPRLASLHVEGERLRLEALGAPGEVRVAGLRLPAGRPRLVLAGEEVQLPGGVTLRLLAGEARAPHGTASVFLHLLGGGAPELAAGRGATLTCLTGEGAGRVHVLPADVVLGRSRAASVRLVDPAVSRRHARLWREGAHTRLEDLGSPNGVRVGGRRVGRDGPVLLADGDVLELGETLLRYGAPSPEEDAPRPDGVTPLADSGPEAGQDGGAADPDAGDAEPDGAGPRRLPLASAALAGALLLALLGLALLAAG